MATIDWSEGLDPTVDDHGDDAVTGKGADPRAYRSEPYLQTGEVDVNDIFAAAARSAGVTVGAGNDGPDHSHDPIRDSSATGTDVGVDLLPVDDEDDPDDGGRDDGGRGHGGPGRIRRFPRRHPKTSIAIGIVIIVLIPLTFSYLGALRKEGNETFMGRTTGWMRDMKMGFIVDWVEQRKYSTDQFVQGGTPDADAFKPVDSASTSTQPNQTVAPVTIPHTPVPVRMKSPVDPPADGEGEWTGIGPLTEGLPGVYITKVRPNVEHSSLVVFLAWIDPMLVNVRLLPGTELPGGKWNAPNYLTPEICPSAILAMNGGFRFESARGGYYGEGREPIKLRDGAASLVFWKDGRVDVVQWGREAGNNDLPNIESVRQNLELMVDDGVAVPATSGDGDWGAKLPNSYFVWRSGYGITKDGALVYAGGPALKPAELAQTLINAGAVRVMEGDINPEWVIANIHSVDATTGECTGKRGIEGTEDKGGMRKPGDTYLESSTRDFVAVFAKQQ